MPEMPAMQALAERLDVLVAGRILEAVSALHFSALKTVSPPPQVLEGQRARSVDATGKYLVFDLRDAQLLLHLSQGGRVKIEEPPKTTRPKNGVVRLTFAEGPAVLVTEFGTERKAAWWVLAPGDPGPRAGLGLDPLGEAFADLLRTGEDRRHLHSLLRDQRTVAGIGRGYADDILHRARLSPFASLSGLDAEARQGLTEAVRSVLSEGLEIERRRTGGLPAKLGDHWIVHARHGQPCPACGSTLRRVSFESYEITYCPPCQTGGRELKDRRMSRLLR